MIQEEKYKEALLEARALLEPCLKYSNGKVREALDSIDKELKSFESEDERIMKTIRQLLETARDAHSNTSLAQPYIDALAWLEKQKEQKPAEWSEEDEEKIVTISEIIEHCTTIPYSGGTLTLNKEYKKELLCFIKSLRPQYHGDVTMTEAYKMGLEAGKASSWKPSEEQIEALVAATLRYQSTGLESLYEDLKKLKYE